MFKNLFRSKKGEQKGLVTAIKFKGTIKALGMETYRNITILYLLKPRKDVEATALEKFPGTLDFYQPIYHFFHKKEFYFEEADTYEELIEKAHEFIDDKIYG